MRLFLWRYDLSIFLNFIDLTTTSLIHLYNLKICYPSFQCVIFKFLNAASKIKYYKEKSVSLFFPNSFNRFMCDERASQKLDFKL